MEKPLLSIRDLAIDFHTDSGDFRAVDGLSLDIPHGKTVAVVGESGSGKSVTAQAILRILPKAARISAGSIRFNDPAAPETTVDITALGADSERMRALRGGRIAMIFQEPMTSLSPLHTVGDQVTEALSLHADVGREEAKARAVDVFARVGFPDPKRALVTYPFELSGGLRQRAMIAMALIAKPALLIADEPTTALDVTTQAQILDLMKELQADTCMSLMLITHDLGVVANMADEVAVMYRGRVMEAGKREEIFRNPRHPYLQALMRAVPRFDMQPGERLTPIREVRSAALAQKADEPPPPQPAGIVLKAERICKTFTLRSGWFSGRTRTIHAVNGVSLALPRGKTLGLVGESGCGKTTLSKIITRALAPDSGHVLFDDGSGPKDVHKLENGDLKAFRRAVQFIFQDPFSSLNPRMTVYETLTEPLLIHGIGTPDERYGRAKELLDMVGLDQRSLRRYPALVFRRPAPASRHRPRPCAEPAGAALRRAGLGARRLGAGAGAQPPQGPAGRPRPVLPVRLAQSRGGRLHRRHDRRDVPRLHRRGGAEGRRSSATRFTLTRRRCSRPCRIRTSTIPSISPSCATTASPSPRNGPSRSG